MLYSLDRSIRISDQMMMKTICENEDDDVSSCSSSIGEDSDDDDDAENGGRGSFDDAIQALQQALPIRRGISTFYKGKSKSFTNLADVGPSTTSSIQDIAKPENAYTRKRRNFGVFKLSNTNTNTNTGGISKKSKTTMLRFTLERNSPSFPKQGIPSQINRPLAMRSFSMVDLHRNATKIGNC